jgi:hypothetical protein
VAASFVNKPSGGNVDTVLTFATHFFLLGAFFFAAALLGILFPGLFCDQNCCNALQCNA